ncbi:hypothetical protein AVP42_00529 [Agromyces sp. NDB4Y10]|uniref:hypothetical protein n=1 Tax=Agromyces sp. NDB4Y10 TaxID=1775951 RepID=UPI0007B280E4|nr:hypothetical protein [Agromyces sp. NDB4Y10]KZE95137.1 hypothetical protein AVP42_00529 [Agromyces sp. NDB4Y10]
MDAIGGGVLVAVAATLWVAYLLPSWLRRRQYLATERNAVRLQQTLRILAETAETPGEVRVGMTARDIAAQERILHEHELAARLEAQAAENLAIAERIAAEEAAAAAERELAERAARARAEAARAADAATGASPTLRAAGLTRRGLRRRRAACSLVLLTSLLTALVGLVALPFGGTPLIALGGAGGVAIALIGLVVLARVRPAPVAVVAAPIVRPEAQPFEPIETDEDEVDREPGEGWTPQPLPKPLHLSRGTIAASAMASIAEAEQLKRAAAEAELAERAERLEPQVPVLRPAAASAAPATDAEPAEERSPVAVNGGPDASSPYARMGIIDAAEPGISDLDLVLRRRRTAV